MEKIKICFISLHAYPLFNPKCEATFGGAEVKLYQLSKEIAKDRRYETFFIVGNFGQNKKEVIDSVEIYRSRSLKKMKFNYVFGFFRQLKFFIDLIRINADVYIQSAAGMETGVINFFSKFFKRKFLYMTSSDTNVDGRYRKNNPLAGIFYEYGLRNCDMVITQNEEHKKLLKEKFGKDSIVVKNMFAISKNMLGLDDREHTLWVGTSRWLKQPEFFLEIAKSIPEEKFLMIMPKSDVGLWNEIFVKANGISNLRFMEKVPFHEINKYFRKAKLFINSSIYEGFPNTFVQSAINGTPIVSLNVNPDNFLNEHNCGFCANGSREKMIEEIRHILKDKSHWEIMSKNAYNYAKDNHEISKIVKKLLEIIDDSR